MEVVEKEEMDGRSASLPLARIKKVMKSDEEVKVGLRDRLPPGPAYNAKADSRNWQMISAEGGFSVPVPLSLSLSLSLVDGKRNLQGEIVPIMFSKACESRFSPSRPSTPVM